MFSSVALAADEAQKVAAQPSFFESMIPFVLIIAVMYFLVFRPQAKKAKEQETLLNTLKPGDEVVTSGGIIGKVKSITDNFIAIDTGSTVLKVVKTNVSAKTKS